MSEDKKVKLTNDDWKDLLPGENYKLGHTTLFIQPLGIEALAKVLKRLEEVIKIWKDMILRDQEEVKFQGSKKKKGNQHKAKNKKETQSLVERILEMLPKLSQMIQEHGIDIISDLAGVVKEDIARLPAKESVKLFEFCLEVNIKSQEGLEKNFQSLGWMVARLTQGPATARQTSSENDGNVSEETTKETTENTQPDS